ncbi:ribosomal protein RSM22 (predicted rRNA methylase) [Branchiibius hedensis]|uniref:Ribosomal protein RSM22 (Predicted rRNA methylase) n=1 Tax=Branchiibius hedensis TaxID=672460 RepID=A0A2Y8ZV71_9MICO|nr:ribosomal protein RSM22 (predicted rRNA methylase) [Branchiibius hedensis]SSA36191.1 Ribosomal protein RSM22 (predicted rRNA methylase) [Branchiibius hedensis]
MSESSLSDALEAATRGVPVAQLTAAVRRLSDRYRQESPASAPLMASAIDVVAYAAYRMPATYAACHAALSSLPTEVVVSSVLDLGGGTGAAAWAVDSLWPGARTTIAEQVPAARSLALDLAAGGPAVAAVPWRLGESLAVSADLVTASYVLSELTDVQQDSLVSVALSHARWAVLLIEPGTPGGYQRILRARSQVLQAGWQIAAPCPHALGCPLVAPDWCHFAVRVPRSSLHRQVKGGELSYEDEKFSYLLAVARDVAVPEPSARVLRHPVKRKGLVELTLCRPDGSAGREIVSKKQGPRYRAARDVDWGDNFV